MFLLDFLIYSSRPSTRCPLLINTANSSYALYFYMKCKKYLLHVHVTDIYKIFGQLFADNSNGNRFQYSSEANFKVILKKSVNFRIFLLIIVGQKEL